MIVVALGALLLIPSSYYVGLQLREVLVGRTAYARYHVTPLYGAVSAGFMGHTVSLSDAFTGGTYGPEDQRRGPVQIVIDGRDYSSRTDVEIRPYFRDSERYRGLGAWVQIARLADEETHTEVMAVVQRISGVGFNLDLRSLRFRVVFLASEGQVRIEEFAFGDRAWPRYRTMLARFVSPQGIGFYSEVLQGWPSVFYPLLFPWVSSIVGLGLVVAGGWRWLKSRRRIHGAQ